MPEPILLRISLLYRVLSVMRMGCRNLQLALGPSPQWSNHMAHFSRKLRLQSTVALLLVTTSHSLNASADRRTSLVRNLNAFIFCQIKPLLSLIIKRD